MSAILEILIALPAAGKSTYAKNLMKMDPNIVVVSSDAIRKELYGSEEDQSHNQEVFNEVFNRTRAALANDLHVIVDATNLSRKRRIAFLKQFNNCEKRATVFAIPFEVCCERNNSRERTVPQYVMDRMYRSFEPPHYAEGFDSISIVNYNSLVGMSDILAENARCDHDNPHHKLSCGMHCYAAADYIGIKYGDCEDAFINENYSVLYFAAKYHDVSKYKVKVFHNMKGEPTVDAHYYFHQNVSAYDFLAHCRSFISTKKLILIANLISNHMVFFEGAAAIDKKRKLYGEEFWKLLEIVHEADLAAH
jgi:predicted kinase